MDRADLSRQVKALAAGVGFDRSGITKPHPIGRAGYLRDWLARSKSGTMHYLHKHGKIRENPAEILDGARSVIAVALVYHQRPEKDAEAVSGVRGRVAQYAWGDDYHAVMKGMLRRLVDRMRVALELTFDSRICVDTAPILERELAAAAGVGWIGKNTLVMHQDIGSYFFLGEIFTTLDLAPDEPVADHCGTCTACLDACPTDAFPAPYQMDASRCISYLTIEHRGDIPEEFHADMGDWVFGCDVCQEVCPHNNHAPVTRTPQFALRPPGPKPLLDDVIEWSEDEYRTQLRGSAGKRAKIEMWQRNARIARDNQRSQPTQTPPAER